MQDVVEKPEKLKLRTEAEYSKNAGMSQTEYAEYRGFSKQAVSKHKMAGRLVFLDNGNIDVASSDAKLDAEMDPAFTGNADVQKGCKRGFDVDVGEGHLNPQAFSERKLYRFNLQIQRDELAMEKERGKIVYRISVEKAFSAKILAVITRLQRVPRRLAAKLALESDRLKCETMVERELTEAVEEFS